MNFDFEKLQAAAELGEVIRLQNEALELLVEFRRERPYLIVPNMARMVEENLKENVQILYKEMNNMHKPPSQQKRHICRECSMGFAVALPGGICDECRSKRVQSSPRVLPPQTKVGTNEQSLEELMAEAVRENPDTADAPPADTETPAAEGATPGEDHMETEAMEVDAEETPDTISEMLQQDEAVDPESPKPGIEEPGIESPVEEPEPTESPVEDPDPAERPPMDDPEPTSPPIEEPAGESPSKETPQ